MRVDYSNVTNEQLEQILSDFYNYVMDNHDCVLRNEQIDLFIEDQRGGGDGGD